MMEVKKNGGRIKISFPYNPDYIAKIKTIAGYRWHPEGRYWSVPYSEFEKLLSVFDGENLVIDSSIYLDELKKELVLRKYSQRTIKLYLYHNREFLEFSKKNPYEVSNKDIRNYLYHLANDKEVSTSTLNTAINALKFYYGEVLKRRFVYEIKRPRKDKKLPVVLSHDFLPLSVVRSLAEKQGFEFVESFGKKKNYTANFRKPDQMSKSKFKEG